MFSVCATYERTNVVVGYKLVEPYYNNITRIILLLCITSTGYKNENKNKIKPRPSLFARGI